MPDEDRKILIEILQRVTKVETKVDEMTNAKDIAQEALHSTQSAHHRIDELKTDYEKDFTKIEGNQTGLWRTALTGLVSGIVTAITLIFGYLTNHK